MNSKTSHDREAVPLPSTPQEFINLVAHYYRGEIARMAGWRDRVDRTTNWAITCVAGMLSISLSSPVHHHEILIFAMMIVLLLLIIESRRYRFFDVYRRRVRTIERYYYAPVFRLEEADAGVDWAKALSEDLRKPTFAISQIDAFSRRLRRNFLWLFAILFFAWALQIAGWFSLDQNHKGSFPADLVNNASVGPIPGSAVIIAVLCFYGLLIVAALARTKPSGDLFSGDAHV